MIFWRKQQQGDQMRIRWGSRDHRRLVRSWDQLSLQHRARRWTTLQRSRRVPSWCQVCHRRPMRWKATMQPRVRNFLFIKMLIITQDSETPSSVIHATEPQSTSRSLTSATRSPSQRMLQKSTLTNQRRWCKFIFSIFSFNKNHAKPQTALRTSNQLHQRSQSKINITAGFAYFYLPLQLIIPAGALENKCIKRKLSSRNSKN